MKKYLFLALVLLLPVGARANYLATGSTDPGTNGCYTLDVADSPHNGIDVYTNVPDGGLEYMYYGTFVNDNQMFTAVVDISADYLPLVPQGAAAGDYANTWRANGLPSPPTVVVSSCGAPPPPPFQPPFQWPDWTNTFSPDFFAFTSRYGGVLAYIAAGLLFLAVVKLAILLAQGFNIFMKKNRP